MAKTAKTFDAAAQGALKALAQSAKQALTLAAAYGVMVPYAKTKATQTVPATR